MAKFLNVIENAKIACEQSKFIIGEHFTQVGKTSKMPNGGVKNFDQFHNAGYKGLYNGGTMPEDLPTPKKIFKRIRKRNGKKRKNRNKITYK